MSALSAHVLRVIGKRPPQVDRTEAIKAISQVVAEMRDDAIKARKESGIEECWRQCEEQYLGIDDLTRADFTSARWAKPMTMEGALVSNSRARGADGKSTAYVRVTARYVDAGAAKIGEITQAVDEKPFALKATPVPDLIAGAEDERAITKQGQPVMQAGPDGQPVPVKVADLAKHHMEQADTAAEKASTRIYDWMVESGRAGQMRKVIFDMARLGTGVMKGPIPRRIKRKAVTRNEAGVTLSFAEETKPVSEWVDLWNFFPSRDCGEDVKSGSYVVERDFLSVAAVRKLIGQPGYIEEAIRQVIKEGPGKINEQQDRPEMGKKDGRFEVWYLHGQIEAAHLRALNPGDAVEDGETVFAIVTMINDTVVKAVLNPLESGAIPYHAAVWRRRVGYWAGVGVGEQIALPQKIINAATRAALDNAGKSAGSQFVIDRGSIEPANQNDWRILPDKVWFKTEGSAMDDVRKAFATFQIPNLTAPLMSMIEYGFKLAEESTSIPLITQGQSGKTTPDTFSGAQLQDNNANQLLRDVGMSIADNITTPEVSQYYEWLLLDTSVPDDEKGDFQVNTDSSAAMIERAVQDQMIQQMGQMVSNPAFGIDPKRWFAELLKSKKLDPRKVQYTEQELEQQQQNPQPPLPIAVAQVRAQSAEKIAQIKNEADVQKMAIDKDRDTVYVNAEAQRAQAVADAAIEKLRLQREIANLNYQTKLMEFANDKQMSVDKAKTELAKTAMELNVQRELAAATGHAKQVAPTDMEPVGRAPDGQAFQK